MSLFDLRKKITEQISILKDGCCDSDELHCRFQRAWVELEGCLEWVDKEIFKQESRLVELKKEYKEELEEKDEINAFATLQVIDEVCDMVGKKEREE